MNKNIKFYGIIGGAVLGGILILSFLFGAIGVVDGGTYVVKQSFFTGDISVISDSGPYARMWGRTVTYPESFEIYLSTSDQDGGKGADTQAVKVIFNDGSYADLSSVTKVFIPKDDVTRERLHIEFRSAASVKTFTRQYIEAILKRSGSLFKAEEAYASKRSQLENIIDGQIRYGKYATEPITETEPTGEVDDEGEPIVVQVKKTVVKNDAQNQPIIEDEGFIQQYGLEVRSFSLKDVDPDSRTLELIEAKKRAEQQRMVAQTEAEKSKQDAITAAEKGKADVAEAEARELVAKITAVTRAQKDKEVAELNAQRELAVAEFNAKKAEQEARAEITKKEAEARAAKLLVSAGLTPMQKAEWNYKTQVGVADAIFKNYKVPEIMITGGESGGANPLDAIAINQLMEIVEKMSK